MSLNEDVPCYRGRLLGQIRQPIPNIHNLTMSMCFSSLSRLFKLSCVAKITEYQTLSAKGIILVMSLYGDAACEGTGLDHIPEFSQELPLSQELQSLQETTLEDHFFGICEYVREM